MRQIPATPPANRHRFSSRAVACCLGTAFVLVLAAGLWWLARVDAERRQAGREAQAWLRAVENLMELGPALASIYAVAMEPAMAPGEGPPAIRAAAVRSSFEIRFAAIAAELRSLAITRDYDSILRELDEMQAPAQAVLGQLEAIRGPGGPRADEPEERLHLRELMQTMHRRYEEAVAARGKLRRHEQRIARDLLAEQEQAAARFLEIAAGLGAALLGVFGLAVVHWRQRQRCAQADARECERLLGQLRDADTKYRSIFDNAIEGIFQTTPSGSFVTANRALARMYGYETPERLMESLTDVAAQLYVDPSQRQSLLEALQQDDVVSNFEFEVVRADGRTMWVRENVHAVRDERGELLYLEGTVEDVSDLWWGEQRRRLQYALARVIGDAITVEAARPHILAAIGKGLAWDIGIAWELNGGEEMHAVEMWHAPEVLTEELVGALPHMSCQRGQKLVGEVWDSGEPKWIADLSEDPGCPNAEVAAACGMSSSFAIPLVVNGEVRRVLEFFSPKITLPDPELLQTLGSISSQLGHLIERKRAEEALRRSEMRKAAILRSALDCIITFDLEGRITEFNPAAERAFGYSPIEALGREMSTLIIPETLHEKNKRGLAIYHATDAGPTPGRRMELVARRADGREFPVEVAISRILIDAKPMFTAYLRDITERQEAERITSELAAVVAHSNDAIVGCTLEGKIVSWNVGAERVYGYPAEEVIGRPLDILIPPDRLDEFPQALTTVQRGDSLANYETVRLRKDGKRISVSLTESPIRSERGRVSGLSSIARDITERKRLEEELLQSQKMDAVGRLAGGIAHDFNNILTAILGYSDLIIGQIDEKYWMYKHLSEIRKAADFAAALTHQLLAFSRRQPLFLRVFSINDCVKNMQRMLQRVIGEHIQIHTQLKAEVGRLKADPSQFEQVLLNLCVNARDAMPGGGSITIQTADVTYFLDDSYSVNEMPAGEYVKLTITDSGTGMSDDVKKHIFEPFFTTKEKGQGTGLGLATCYGIVKQSGGYITVDSVVGVGTTFSIYLPRVDESGEKSNARKEVGQLPGGHETVLYVEDEITVRSLTSHILRRLGYTVIEAGSGKQAREAMEHHNGHDVDLLFSDVVLPDAGGKELAEWILSRRNGHTKLLFTSGYVDESILRRHGLEVDTAFLQKPFTPADLAKKVREVLDDSAN